MKSDKHQFRKTDEDQSDHAASCRLMATDHGLCFPVNVDQDQTA